MNLKLSFKQSILAGLTAGVVSAIINAVLFFITHSAGILTDTVFVQPNQPLTVGPIVVASLVPHSCNEKGILGLSSCTASTSQRISENLAHTPQ